MANEEKHVHINENKAIADPAALGLACFALTTFCLSVVNAGLVAGETVGMVLMLALGYGGATQILAGMWEFKKNNVFGAAAFSSYGAFWVCLALYEHGAASWGWIEATPTATFLFLLAWTIFTLYMWIGSFALNNALLTVFTLLLLTFILLDIGVWVPSIHILGGYVGILTAFAAWYTSAAVVLNTVYGRTVLPTGPRVVSQPEQSKAVSK